MADTTQQWLEQNCGNPSGNWGSTYSDIFSKTKSYELEPTDKKCEELIKLIEKFSYSKHSGAKTQEQGQAKDLMQRNLNEFSYALRVARLHRNPDRAKQIQEQISKGKKEFPDEHRKVLEVIEEMKESAIPLIRNTGHGLAGAKRIDMVPSVNVRGAMTIQNVLIINPSVVRNRSELIGLMVHEYHHALCRHNGTFTYVDEIVAHWKEYSVIKPPADPATRIAEIKRQVERLYASAEWH